MNDKKQTEPGFIKVKVTVTRNSDGTYTDKFHPEVIPVTESDSVIQFRLDSHTADDIAIRSVTISPEDQDQLSNPTISKNGKQAVLSDVNSSVGTFNLSFAYQDKKGQRLAMMAKSTDSAKCESIQYPEIENEPPPV